jgi:hypothetical protein
VRANTRDRLASNNEAGERSTDVGETARSSEDGGEIGIEAEAVRQFIPRDSLLFRGFAFFVCMNEDFSLSSKLFALLKKFIVKSGVVHYNGSKHVRA